MSREVILVDAFADRPFVGNPAAVCILDEAAGVGWMRRVAREMNLSETAFVVPHEAEKYGLRWFTPTVEVDLCGHATLASAHVLWESGRLAPGVPARFATPSGPLTAEVGDDGWITLDFPALGPVEAERPSVADLARAFGVPADSIVGSTMSRHDLLVELSSAATIVGMTPDLGRVAMIPTRGVIVTARSEPASVPESDFTSRFFAPNAGVAEDPVTGSAHCVLGPYWAARLGRDRLVGYQASARGGLVRVAVVGDRVRLAGRAVTILRGRLAEGADPIRDLDE